MYAWIFVSTSDSSTYTEFIEWKSETSDSIVVQRAIAAEWLALNAAFPYEDSDTWKSAIF